MPKSREKAAKAMPRRRKAARAADVAAPAHLPLQAPPDSASPTSVSVPTKRDRTVLPSNSLVRQKVLAIIGLRLEGKSNEEIAATLHIKEASVRQYMWLAGKNGWLKKHAVDPNDRLEHEIAHKVVRNLDEMLDSPDNTRRDKATLASAEGMFFKKMSGEADKQPPLAVIGIRIEHAPGASTDIREGTTGGNGRFIEGVAKELNESDDA